MCRNFCQLKPKIEPQEFSGKMARKSKRNSALSLRLPPCSKSWVVAMLVKTVTQLWKEQWERWTRLAMEVEETRSLLTLWLLSTWAKILALSLWHMLVMFSASTCAMWRTIPRFLKPLTGLVCEQGWVQENIVSDRVNASGTGIRTTSLTMPPCRHARRNPNSISSTEESGSDAGSWKGSCWIPTAFLLKGFSKQRRIPEFLNAFGKCRPFCSAPKVAMIF